MPRETCRLLRLNQEITSMEPAPYRELSTTRLFVPPLPPSLLPRPELIHRLDEAMNRKFTLLSAPAGYGKTTQLRAWAAQTLHPVAWLSLTQAENDPASFWSYVLAACRTIHAQLDPNIFMPLQLPEPPPLEALLTSFLNLLAAVPQPFTLVLDDYHFITEATVHRTLRLFLDQQPPHIH